MYYKFTFIFLFFVLLLSSPVYSLQITSEDSLLLERDLIDFSQFNSSHYQIVGPVQIGELVGLDVTASSETSSLTLWNGAYGLGGNGNWGYISELSMHGYIAIEPFDNGTVRIDFNNAPISGFGGFMNYVYGSSSVFLKAYSFGGELLELFDIVKDAPIYTPNALNGGEFRGIQRYVNDISYIEISGSGIVFDNLVFTSAVQSSVPVPEPGTLLLLGSGLAGLAVYRRRMHKA